MNTYMFGSTHTHTSFHTCIFTHELLTVVANKENTNKKNTLQTDTPPSASLHPVQSKAACMLRRQLEDSGLAAV